MRRELDDGQLDWVDEEQQSLLNCTGEALRQPSDHASQPQLWDEPPATALCARLVGFSIHAARRVEDHDRGGLERLCRYGLRAPFALERFSLTRAGKVCYTLRRPWPKAGGRTELRLEPTALLRRLAALIPAPYTNLVRYHGVLHNRSKARPLMPRPKLVAVPTHAPPPDDVGGQSESSKATKTNRPGWAQLLRRVLDIDVLSCPSCTTAMLVVAFITCPKAIHRILQHLNLDATAPALAPAELPQDDNLDFSQLLPDDEHVFPITAKPASQPGRDPPNAPAPDSCHDQVCQ